MARVVVNPYIYIYVITFYYTSYFFRKTTRYNRCENLTKEISIQQNYTTDLYFCFFWPPIPYSVTYKLSKNLPNLSFARTSLNLNSSNTNLPDTGQLKKLVNNEQFGQCEKNIGGKIVTHNHMLYSTIL